MNFQSVLRLCHVCNHVSEAEKEVLRCGKCGKAFLPLSSLEKIMLAASQSGSQASNGPANEDSLERNFMVIQGLMALW